MEAGLVFLVFVQRHQADMAGFAVPVAGVFLVEAHLEAGQQQEIRVGQVVVGHHQLVVGDAQHGIAVGFVGLLQLLRRQPPVGDGGMAVEIGLVKLPLAGEKIFYHG